MNTRWLYFFIVLMWAGPASAQAGWSADGVPHATVKSAVNALKPKLHGCYTAHVPAASRTHGDIVTLRVTVSEQGSVFRVDFLEGSTSSKKFERCIRERFEALKFGEQKAKTKFVQRIGFQNGLANTLVEEPRAAGGAINKEAVVAMANARSAEIQACYKSALTSNPSLRGQVLVEVVVDGSRGSVRSSRVVKSTLQHPETERCVLKVLDGFAFGVSEDRGIVIVQFPLTFDDDTGSAP